jgi:hypothetical protein
MITQQQCLDLFEYRDGELFWKVRKAKANHIGDKAGHLNNTGYYRVSIDYKLYLIHRIIFLMHHGYLPQFLDHIDNNPQNNRIENLRPATKTQNICNTSLRKNNTSGVKGVVWIRSIKKWEVRVDINHKRHTFGYFKDLAEAAKVAEKARNELHKEFARHE